jgi:formamidopyrimidine-DNA glycosylase
MPELPDLQAFSRNLSRKLVGKRVEKIHAIYKKKLKTTEADLKRAIEGAKVSSIFREGKELRFAFDNGTVLGLHLMLKGQLHYFEGKNENKYTIIEIHFNNGLGLALTDFQGQATPTLNPLPREAPDALSREAGYRYLKEKINQSKAAIKKLLMDQEIIRGIGNAYSDEILWHARISPFSICNKLPDDAIKQLSKSIRSVFRTAERQILKADPEIIGGEIRDFMAIHNPKRTHSPTGYEIMKDDSGGRKTYYTDEQTLWQ